MLRELDIPATWVAAKDLGSLPKLLGSDIEPEQARELQGTLTFMFPELEVEDIRIFDTPGVIPWLALLYERMPYVAYFLQPSPMLGALEGLLLALMPDEVREKLGSQEAPLSEELTGKLAEKLLACANFATDHGDDWKPIVARFIEPLGEGYQELLIEIVRESVD